MRIRIAVAALLCCVCAIALHARDEGMWPFNNVPRADIQKKYGVQLTDQWLDRVQKAVVRLESGCTGSFVSPEGLVLTNHHCAQSCLADNSSPTKNLVEDGYQAATRADELKCQGEQISVLMGMQEVTADVTKAVAGAAAADLARQRNQTLTSLEERCENDAKTAGTPLKCETVTLYQGGQYWLYKYKRYDDIRLAFAPEYGISAFGGDPDNFQFPRWCLDFSLLRVYENGRPASPAASFRVNWSGPAAGQPLFVAGHPGTTSRQLTAEQLRTQRDVYLPFWLARYAELRGRLVQYSKTSPAAAQAAKDTLDSIENVIKVRRMELTTLLRDPVIEQHVEQESSLRKAVAANAELARRIGTPWDDIARAQRTYRAILQPYTWIAAGAGFQSDLFAYARQIVRAAEERAKPNGERLREYTDARLPALKQSLAADAPVDAGLEQLRLSFSLERMREYLGPDHPIVSKALGTASPDDRAKALITGSKLGDPKTRLALFDGGAAAVAASTDPMIALARAVDADARALTKTYDNEVAAPVARAQQAIADARFAVYGAAGYPDSTFTLRLSYGALDGWTEEDGRRIDPVSRFARLFERATGSDPFALPKRWLDARSRLDPNTAANFSTTHDIVGGNSGSPVINPAGEVVGLIFDGNIHSISGSYWYDAAKNRSISVHPAFIRAALRDVYQAPQIAAELGIR